VSDPRAFPTPVPGRGPDITAAEAAALPDGVLLLDVREPAEWAAGHAPDATHLPLMQLPQAELDRSVPIVVVCHVGGRSARAAEYLGAAGFAVRNLAGGMAAWQRAGLPVVRDDGSPGLID
jgi:rhodanese-related sulfurtransferase